MEDGIFELLKKANKGISNDKDDNPGRARPVARAGRGRARRRQRGDGLGAARLKARGFTILLVEQNFRFAAKVSDRLFVVEQGAVVDRFNRDEITGFQA